MKKLLLVASMCYAFQAQAAFDGEFLNELTKQGQNLTVKERKQFVNELIGKNESQLNIDAKHVLSDIFCKFIQSNILRQQIEESKQRLHIYKSQLTSAKQKLLESQSELVQKEMFKITGKELPQRLTPEKAQNVVSGIEEKFQLIQEKFSQLSAQFKSIQRELFKNVDENANLANALDPMKNMLIQIALNSRNVDIEAVKTTTPDAPAGTRDKARYKRDAIAKATAKVLADWIDANPEVAAQEKRFAKDLENGTQVAQVVPVAPMTEEERQAFADRLAAEELEAKAAREKLAEAKAIADEVNKNRTLAPQRKTPQENIPRLYRDHKGQNKEDKKNRTIEKKNRRNGDDY